jgi:ABC-type antimicrobial peptide transport system permease subunit
LVWQGIALALAITVIGTPLGLLLGTLFWRLIADSFGVRPSPVIPAAVALLVPAAIAMGVAASVVPARRARRADVARLLRAE